jgi:hypothetical protein
MITIKKAESRERVVGAWRDDGSIIPGTRDGGLWWPLETPRGKSAIVSCPGCQEHWALDGWTIAADGSVSPSVDHSRPIQKTDGTVIRDCLFHDYIKLEGWVA